MMLCRTILLATALLYALGAAAQTTRVRGRVTDAADGHPLQFASVVFPGTTTGITTDEEGIYALETRDTSTRVQASIVGYAPATQAITPGTFNEVNFALRAVEFGIDRVVITPGDNPALPILREAIRRRAENDPEQYDTYRCRTYTKMELDLTNIRPGFRNKRLQRNFGFVFDYMDTSALTGQPYLPAMISESSADLYHSLSPSFTREVIRASRVSGVEDSFAVAQFTGGMHGDVNFYDNFIDLFDVRFAGPLGPSGTSFYNYFLVDSLTVDGRKTYKIRFHPRRLTSPVLDGELHIDSASYAPALGLGPHAAGRERQWIRHLRLDNENSPTPDGRWFRDRDRVSAEFSLTTADSSKLVSFIGTREISYSDVHIGEPIPEEVLRMDNRVVLADEETNRRDEAFWETVRPYALSDRERGIYSMVDSIQEVPLYHNIYTLINTLIVGHWNTKYIGIGPYYKMASFNRLEGFRMQLGGRTTTELSRRFRISGYAAYGTRDGRFKGGGSLEVAFNRQLTRELTLSGRHDVLQLGAGENALTESNILSSILSRGDTRLSMVDEGDLAYEHEWRHGVTAFLGTRLRRIHANRYVPMCYPDGRPAGSVADASVRVGLRFAKDETVYRLPFDKQSLGSKYPITTLFFHGRHPGNPRPKQPLLPHRGIAPLPPRTAAPRLLGPHAAGRPHLGPGPLPAAQAPRRQRHLLLRPLRLLVHGLLRICLRHVVRLVLRAPLQRHPARAPAPDQATQVARGGHLQGCLGHTLRTQQRRTPRLGRPAALPAGHDLRLDALCRGRLRHREHPAHLPRRFHLAPHTPRPAARRTDPALRGQSGRAAQILRPEGSGCRIFSYLCPLKTTRR